MDLSTNVEMVLAYLSSDIGSFLPLHLPLLQWWSARLLVAVWKCKSEEATQQTRSPKLELLWLGCLYRRRVLPVPAQGRIGGIR
jgi:hypothetical protein